MKKSHSLWLQILIVLVVVVALVVLGNWMTFYCASVIGKNYAAGTFVYAGIAAIVAAGVLYAFKAFGLVKNLVILLASVITLIAIPITYYTAYDYRFFMPYESGYGLDFKHWHSNEQNLYVYDEWGDYVGRWGGKDIQLWVNKTGRDDVAPDIVILFIDLNKGVGMIEVYKDMRFTKEHFPMKNAPFQLVPTNDSIYNVYLKKINSTPGLRKIEL